MISYVTKQEYLALGYDAIPEGEIEKHLKEASMLVDKLTFGRTRSYYLHHKLTPFQEEILQDVVCREADFLYENQDVIDSVFDSYSINSVSMHIGSGIGIDIYNGVPVPKIVYALLEETGLCCRLAR